MAEQQQESMGFVWVLVALIVFGALAWYFGRTQLATAFFYIKRAEIDIVNFFGGAFTDFSAVKEYILTANPGTVPFEAVMAITTKVGLVLRYPICILLLLMSIVLFSRELGARYSNVYTTKTLLENEVVNWPYAKFSLSKNLIKEDVEKGQWAMAIRPLDFAKKYKLLKREARKAPEAGLSRDISISVSLRKAKTARLFTRQLGALWEGVDRLNDYTKALFAAFIAKSARDSKMAEKLIRQYADSVPDGRINMSGVEETIAKYKDYPPVAEIIDRHAYVLTIMASLLQLARSDGVIASAEFNWVKGMDRRLWFMLNAVGRYTASVEAAGPFAHWLAEKEMGRRLQTPMVDEAVTALDKAIQEIHIDEGVFK